MFIITMATVSDLKPCRDLLDFKFEGYKLSLDTIPVLKKPISSGIERFEPDGDECSYHQIRMSALFNHLFQDPWWPTSIFFMSEGHFYWSGLLEDGHLAAPRTVWQFPVESANFGANATLIFPGTDWAIVSNGKDTVHLLHTPSRTAGEPWLTCHSHTVSSCRSSSHLLHGVHLSFPSRQQIDLLLAHFSTTDSTQESKAPTCMVEWLSFVCGQNIQAWNLKRFRRLAGNSALNYAALETSCDAVCLASETEFKLIFDSENPTEQKEETVNEASKEVALYTYVQTAEDITVVFHLPEQTKKSDLQVRFEPSSLEVMLQGKSVLKGKLCNCIDTNSSKWMFCEQRLEVLLSKAEVGLMWQELVKDDRRGEEMMDPTLVEEIHSRLAHLTSETEVIPGDNVQFNINQLEDCDTCTDIMTFVRIDGNTCTHRINMGGHQWLFSTPVCPESLPMLCLRHDVDGIVWQPKNISSDGELEHFKMEHTATFSAFGYVQASKQDKKFLLCAPDFSYSVISDCSRHVYIYCQPENLHSALELRNRKTGEAISHIAKQYVVNLEDCENILGLRVSRECIFVLSRQTLYAIKMSAK